MNPSVRKVLNLIGMAMKSGNLVSGEFSTEKAIKDGKTVLVIIATDASDNTKKKFTNMCIHYKVPIYFFCERDLLSSAIGKRNRASLGLLDKGLGDGIKKQLETII